MKPTSKKDKRLVANEAISEIVAKNEAQDRAIIEAKPHRKMTLSDADLDYALQRLADGDTMRNVTTELGIARASLFIRGIHDEEFNRQLRNALAIGQWTRLEAAGAALAGGEGSTGSIERDKAVADFTKWMASRINRRDFGDRLQVDQRQIMSITLEKDDADV